MFLVLIFFCIGRLLFRKNIKYSKSISEAIKQRKRYGVFRIITILLAFVFGIAYLVYNNIETQQYTNFELVRNICLSLWGFWVAFKYNKDNYKFDSLKGNVSIYSKESFLQKPNEYILYLRGFKSDQYNRAVPTSKRYKKFHELEFMKLLQKKYEICAVGLPEEVESPYGATRVYLENERWKNDVSDLMRNSSHIYILVHSSENCIWEIQESQKYIDKTTYLIDDNKHYNYVRERIKDKINVPLLSREEYQIIAIENKEQTFIINKYENSIKGYSAMLEISYKGIKTRMDGILHVLIMFAIQFVFLFVLFLLVLIISYMANQPF